MDLFMILFVLCFADSLHSAPVLSQDANMNTRPDTPESRPSFIKTEEDHSPIIGFDCNQTEPEILTISTLEVQACPELSRLSPVVTPKYGQIIQRNDLDSVKIVSCQLTKSTFYFRCGGNWLNYNVYPPSIGNIIDVQPKKCSDVHQTGLYLWTYRKEPWSELVANKTYHFSANEVGWSDPTGYCEGGSFQIGGQNFDKVVVQASYTFSLRESWGTVDHTTNTLNIENTVSCPFTKGNCIDAVTGTHVWTPAPRKCPEDNYKLLYQGPINITQSPGHPTILLSVNNPPFLFTSELGVASYVCGIDMTLTEFPNIFFLDQRQGTYQTQLQMPSAQDVKFMTYLNSKITFMYHNLMDSMQKMYLASLFETCKVEREMLRNRIEIIRLNSAAGGLSSLLKPGMFAKTNGEVIHLIKCRSSAVQFRQTEECYDALPIVYNNLPYFLLPNTHIISPFASKIMCSPITPVTYKIGGQWWSFSGTYQQTITPTVLAPSTQLQYNFTKIKSFAKGGMYSSEQVEAIQRLLIFPQLRESITTEFVRGVTHFSPSPVRLDLSNIMSETDWKAVARKNIEYAWGYFTSIGSAFAGIFGMYFIYRIIKGVINCFIDAHDIYQVFGCSFYLLSSVWSRLAQYFINQASRRATHPQGAISSDPGPHPPRGESPATLALEMEPLSAPPLEAHVPEPYIDYFAPLFKRQAPSAPIPRQQHAAGSQDDQD